MSLMTRMVAGVAAAAKDGPLGQLALLVADALGVDSAEIEKAADPTRGSSFAMGVIALSAKMAKADGQVTRDEFAAFRKVFSFADDDLRSVSMVFRMAQEDVAGFDHYAADLAKRLKDHPAVLEDVLDGLFFIGKADGAVTEDELLFLSTVADRFGFSDLEFERIKLSHLPPDEANPYTVLGLEPGADFASVRAAYRRLVQDNHPDRLIARGVPEQFVTMATEKLAAINAAYEVLERSAPR